MVRVGIVGLGRLGMKHAEILSGLPTVDLAAVCSIKADEVERARTRFSVSAGYSAFGDMLADPQIDAVVIATPSGEHCNQVVAALEAGKHVFCEKPLGVTAGQCREAERAVEAHPDCLFMLGFMRRFDATYRRVKKKIDAGDIGIPFLLRAYSLDPDSLIEGAINFAARSGGIFMDMMIHDIDLARWFLGCDPLTVQSIGGNFKYPDFARHKDVDNAAAMMRFEGDKIGLFYAGRTAPHGYHIETEIVGTEGMVRIDAVPRGDRAQFYSPSGVHEECVSNFLERFSDAFTAEFEEFINCIRDSRRPEPGVYDGSKATAIAIAATESLQDGQLRNINEAK